MVISKLRPVLFTVRVLEIGASILELSATEVYSARWDSIISDVHRE